MLVAIKLTELGPICLQQSKNKHLKSIIKLKSCRPACH